MNYFENLPIININDEEFRNLFHRVLITYVKDEQISTYQWKDGDSLPLIAYRLYGSAQLWWVLALLNDIRDINYDMPLTTQQIEDIASETAIYVQFYDSVLGSGQKELPAIATDVTVTFTNADSDTYNVILTPISNDTSLLDELKTTGYGYQRINSTSFKIVKWGSLSGAITFSYAIFKAPSSVEQLNTSDYSDYYTNMLSDADDRRDIKILKSPYLSDFITYFLLILQNGPDAADLLMEGEEIDYNKETIQELNSLKEFDDRIIPDYGSFVAMGDDDMSGNTSFTELDIVDFDFDHQIYISSNPTTSSNQPNVGLFGVRPFYVKPRVYNSGTSDEGFSYVVLSPDGASYDIDSSILESGIGEFTIGSYTTITLENHSDIALASDVILMITRIVDSVNDLPDTGVFGYYVVDKNTVRVYTSGTKQTRFFWCLVNPVGA